MLFGLSVCITLAIVRWGHSWSTRMGGQGGRGWGSSCQWMSRSCGRMALHTLHCWLRSQFHPIQLLTGNGVLGYGMFSGTGLSSSLTSNPWLQTSAISLAQLLLEWKITSLMAMAMVMLMVVPPTSLAGEAPEAREGSLVGVVSHYPSCGPCSLMTTNWCTADSLMPVMDLLVKKTAS